jgi:hypothetical protein
MRASQRVKFETKINKELYRIKTGGRKRANEEEKNK